MNSKKPNSNFQPGIPSFVIWKLFSHPRNPSQPPFHKGRRRVSPFGKGGLRGISGGSWHLGTLFFMRLNSYVI
jgi:hypothetical protein